MSTVSRNPTGSRKQQALAIGAPGPRHPAAGPQPLAFVTGVMADLSGRNGLLQPPLAERRFVDIDAGNFNRRMSEFQPSVSFYVSNELTHDGTLIDIELSFHSMDDFAPESVVRRIPELAVLLQARQQLQDMLTGVGRRGLTDADLQTLVRAACERLDCPVPACLQEPLGQPEARPAGAPA